MTFATNSTATVRDVTGGQILGADLGDTLAFKGVPFAAPPTGLNRWRSPQPVVAWEGVREATTFAPAAMQNSPHFNSGAGSEDCLYLNIWQPREISQPLPVMVYIHGGGFMFGSTHWFDGAALSRRGVVVVTIAYRLNLFGFLAHEELSAESGHGSGNYGLEDQIAALRWVRDNIATFGGDANNVTLFGVSAGGASIGLLTTAPQARGLFHRAIPQSSARMTPPRDGYLFGDDIPLPHAERIGDALLQRAGVSTIAEARQLPAESFLFPSPSRNELLVARGDVLGPVIDHHINFGRHYERYERGEQINVPVLIGSNADDAANVLDDAAPLDLIAGGLGEYREQILALYPYAVDAERIQAQREMITDGRFGWQAWAWARLQSRQPDGAPVYAYHFEYDAPEEWRPGSSGPVHGAENRYIFALWDVAPYAPDGRRPTAEQLAFSELIISYWVNFARTGDPNGPGLPHWPRFQPGAEQMMRLDSTPSVGPTPNLEKLKLWDAFFSARRGQTGATNEVEVTR